MDKDEGTTPIVRILTSVRFWRIERQVLGLCWLLTLTLSDADVQCSGVKKEATGSQMASDSAIYQLCPLGRIT